MKVCLISAPTANQLGNQALGEMDAARMMGELAPVGILSLAAVLEAKGLQPEVVDLNRLYTVGRKIRVEIKLIFAVLPEITSPVAILTSLVSVRFAAAIR